MGAMGERVSDPAGLKTAIKRAMDWGKCAVIHVDVDAAKYMGLSDLHEVSGNNWMWTGTNSKFRNLPTDPVRLMSENFCLKPHFTSEAARTHNGMGFALMSFLGVTGYVKRMKKI